MQRSNVCDSMIASNARINDGMRLVWNFEHDAVTPAQQAAQQAALDALAATTAAARPARRRAP